MNAYSKITTASPQNGAGTTHKKVSWFKCFLLGIGLSEFLLFYFGLQSQGGESIQNWALIPLSCSISLSMIYSADAAGEAFQKGERKPLAVALILGLVFIGIIGYVRIVSGAPFVFTLANFGFYGICCLVSYCRASHQDLFDLEDEIERLILEEAQMRSSTESDQSGFKHFEESYERNRKAQSTEKAEADFELINDSISQADHIMEVADQYEAQRAAQVKDIELSGHNDCDKC